MMRTAIIVTLLLYGLAGLGVYVVYKHVQHTAEKSASWDQENLKRNDHGCPTAVFVAPNGELIQCP
jgi:hypothetical protein